MAACLGAVEQMSILNTYRLTLDRSRQSLVLQHKVIQVLMHGLRLTKWSTALLTHTGTSTEKDRL